MLERGSHFVTYQKTTKAVWNAGARLALIPFQKMEKAVRKAGARLAFRALPEEI